MTKLKIVINYIKSFFYKNELMIEKSIKKKYVFLRNVDFHNSKIGDFSYISNNSIVHNTIIGKYCSIGPNVVIGFGDHPTHLLSTSPVFYSSDCSFDIKPSRNLYAGNQKVVIGNDVWIGANVFVKNGITIGHGAVLGAGAVILKDVPPYAVVVGVPGVVKSFRFPKSTIESLLLLKWWDLSPELIKENVELFAEQNITENLELILELSKPQFNNF